MGAVRATAEKSATASATRAEASRQPFIARAGGGDFFPRVQAKMTVGKPGDKFEQEADGRADKVMRMPAPPVAAPKSCSGSPRTSCSGAGGEDPPSRAPDEKIQKAPADEGSSAPPGREDPARARGKDPESARGKDPEGGASATARRGADPSRARRQNSEADDEKLQKAPAEREQLQRDATAGGGAPAVSGDVQSAIHGKTTGGEPLASDVRGYMEPRFSADFGNVRVHHDAESASLSNQLSRARLHLPEPHLLLARPVPAGHERRPASAGARTDPYDPAGPCGATRARRFKRRRRKLPRPVSSELVKITSNTFEPSQKVKDEIKASGSRGLDVRVFVNGLTSEGSVRNPGPQGGR